ncbi:helix-turn-helix domain-containing protein [Sinorhizobium sp. M4_45]|uniref:helix-turn-helix domain-containing protein n=1 Tax=Sinorhizobium sp. M4_45 TaxID=2037901 RepID=UPI000C9BA803|nr:helix-turn-helix domain-containing protein [Sinorhizobium sp. M4_45]PND29055.1 hypothetical protein CN933_03025 [Sinorhizobium sp. M4_45]
MTGNALKQLRNWVPLTQAAFAEEMGVPLRTYEDLETGKTAVRPVHIQAGKWAVLKTTADGIKGAHLPNELADVAAKALENVALHDACPVCGRPGTLQAPRTGGDYSEYTCQNCSTFRISGTAEAMWDGQSRLQRFRALAKAKSKTAPDSVETPMISSYDLK